MRCLPSAAAGVRRPLALTRRAQARYRCAMCVSLFCVPFLHPYATPPPPIRRPSGVTVRRVRRPRRHPCCRVSVALPRQPHLRAHFRRRCSIRCACQVSRATSFPPSLLPFLPSSFPLSPSPFPFPFLSPLPRLPPSPSPCVHATHLGPAPGPRASAAQLRPPSRLPLPLPLPPAPAFRTQRSARVCWLWTLLPGTA